MNVAREEQFTRPVPHTCPACSPEIGDRSNGFDLDEGVRHGTTMSLGTFRCHGVALLVTWGGQRQFNERQDRAVAGTTRAYSDL
jgi:hypothetical protein